MATAGDKQQTVASFHDARTGDSIGIERSGHLYEVIANREAGVAFSPYYATLEEATSAWREDIAASEQRQAASAAQANIEPRETDTWTLTLRSRTWGTGLTWREIAPITQALAALGDVQFILTKGEISR